MIRVPRPTTFRAPATIALVAAIGAGSMAAAQQPHRVRMPDVATVEITAENGVPEVPFEVVDNHVVLPVSVNGSEPLRVVLDTGMPAPALALFDGPRVEGLGLHIDPSMPVQVRGAGGEGHTRTAQIALDESLAMEGVRIDKTRVIVMPPPEEGFGTHHDGILGYTLFGRFVVELDYDRHVMRLHDPDAYRVPEGAIVLPLTLRGQLPYVTLRVSLSGEPFDAEVVVDLGASHAISLNTDSSAQIEVPAGSLKTILGHGLSGSIEGEVGRVAAIELGRARLENVVASFPVSEHQNPRGIDSLGGNLGSEILRRFDTTFDYRGERLILVPNASFDEPFRFDRSGISLGRGQRMAVEGVIAGSPADEAGIRVDDVITHVDGRPVTGSDYMDVREALMGDGAVELSLERGNEKLVKKLSLRRLI